MEQETKETMEALGITSDAAGTPGNTGIDYKAKYEEAMRKLASAQVDQGRVKKLDAELKVARSKISELERQTVLDTLPENLQDVPESIKETALHLSQQAADRVAAGMDERMANLEKSINEEKARKMAQLSDEFAAKINRDFPEFVKGLKENGAFKAAWNEYQEFNAPSIKNAFATLNYDTLAYHIKRFYNEHDVDPSGGRDPNAAPDPRAMGGGADANRQIPGGRKIYTKSDWETEYDSLIDQYERGSIGPKDFAAKRQVLLDAQKEGRIKP